MKFRLIANIMKIPFQLLLLLITITSAGQNGNLFNTNPLNSQGNTPINSLIDKQKEYIRNSYSAQVETPKELINGKEYESYYSRSPFKPLLFINKARTASLLTRTRRYNNLTLQYDTFLDEVIYTDTSKTINFLFPQIALNNDIIEGFNLYFPDDSAIFRYFRQPECKEMNLKEGFYEIAYQGKSEYLIKHESSFYVREGLPNYEYKPKNYVSVGGKFFVIKNKKSLLSLFGSKAGVVKQYLHSSRIRIKQMNKSQFVSILKFYDSL
jgi:hypothetical protein